MAAVDPNRREGLRRLIVRLQEERRLTTLLVTHDRAEAAELGERVALMLEGQIVQDDAPEELFERPLTAAVARFFGSVNLLRGPVVAGRLTAGGVEIAAPGPDGEATLTIRPERIRFDETSPLRLRVVETSYAGTFVRVRLRGEGLALEAHVPPGAAPTAGEVAGVVLPRDALWRLPAGEVQQAARS
jgi:spermidine/putrescine transport system ATP-binding protein